MAMTIDDLKELLRVDYEDEDTLISRLLASAILYIQGQLGFAIDDSTEFPAGTPADVEHAVMMTAAHWFENREAVGAAVSFNELPMGVDSIIANHRRYTFGSTDG